MSSGFEIAPKQDAPAQQIPEQPIGLGREFVRALDEGYLGQLVVEKLAVLDKSAAKVFKKMTGRDVGAE